MPFLFVFTTLATIELFARATRIPVAVRALLFAWIALQGAIAATGFYLDEMSLPPRFLLAIGPPLLTLVALFATAAGRRFLDSLDLRMLTWMHVVRIPVELVLFWLFREQFVPQDMTFEGANFDIVSGLTAPVAAIALFRNGQPRRMGLLIWNVVCLLLVINVMTRGILSVETPFQKFGFDQPNLGVLVFPFVWLPALIVPLVLVAHFAALRRLTANAA